MLCNYTSRVLEQPWGGVERVKLSHLTRHVIFVCSTANVTMVERMDTVDVKLYHINVTLNKLCINDSEFTVTVTFGQLFNGKCDFFSTNETKNITPGESVMFFPPESTPPMSDVKDYCYIANLSAKGIATVSIFSTQAQNTHTHTHTHTHTLVYTHKAWGGSWSDVLVT